MTTTKIPVEAETGVPGTPSERSHLARGTVVRTALPVLALFVALFLVPTLLSPYWVKVFTSAMIYSVVALGAGLLYSRVGLVSMSQIALLAVGTWVTLRLGFATSWPFPVLLLVAGVITGVIGIGIGLPALRLSGLYLALVTLMAAAAVVVVLNSVQFPNGGSGFQGVVGSVGTVEVMRRPSIARTDLAYYRYVIVVAVLVFLLGAWHTANRPGRAWAAIRQSEAAALAAGVNVTIYKMWAFALASFMTGVAGCLLAADVGSPSAYTFGTQENIVLLAVVVMAGVAGPWTAVLAGLLGKFLPEFLTHVGLSDRFGPLVFGGGLLAALIISTRVAGRKGVQL